jgi:DNA (cytosine-5)-methyltransferase 1
MKRDRSNTRRKIHVYDFFSGCGGTSAGLKAAGLKICFALDNDPVAASTYRLNIPEACFFERDIRDLGIDELARLVRKSRNNSVLFSACAPCQPYSRQNQYRSSKDERIPLLMELAPHVRRIKPDYVFLENVPGMRKDGGRRSPFVEFMKLLGGLGYSYDHNVVPAQDYGVPQLRRRLFLVASRRGPISLPSPTHGPNSPNLRYRTVRDAIAHLPPISAGEEHDYVPNHRAAELSETNLMRLRATPEGGDRRDWPSELTVPCHRRYDGHTDVYGRLFWDKPAPALTTKCIRLSNGRYGHPVQNRALSVREAACLQTFDDSFMFKGNLTDVSRQIGNAVPVKLAQSFGEHILQHYSETAG